MVKRERVANNVYTFQSDNYAQVNAGVIAGPDMAIVVDTLAFPEESKQISDFVKHELQVPVRYLINTHYHADHAWGNMYFPEAMIISHKLCYQFLKEKGMPSLKEEKAHNSTYRNVEIVLPGITFESGNININIGKKTVQIFPLPGHTSDSIAVLIKEDRAMYSGDTLMPIPYIADGDIDDTIASMKLLPKMGLENIVQGHGDVILRGEVERTAKANIHYLIELRKAVRKAGRRKYPLDLLEEIDIEDCGKSRVLMGGLVEQLHFSNVISLYKQLYGKEPEGSEMYFAEK